MMNEILTTAASGALGGLFGGLFGLAKQYLESKERTKNIELQIKREAAEYAEAQKEREYQLAALDKNAKNQIEKTQTEAGAALDLKEMDALIAGSRYEFKDLNTSTAMDDYRASVRPTLAYWSAILFNVMLAWAFWQYKDQIDKQAGLNILIGLFVTLNFIVCSVVNFYYVSRRNPQPHGAPR